MTNDSNISATARRLDCKFERMPHFVSSRDETTQTMSDVSSDFASLRVSALCKASRISSSIDRVTIGPASKATNEDASRTENVENEKNTCNVAAIERETKSQSGVKKSTENSTRSSITFSVKKILLENEMQRREEVRRAIDRRRRHMEESEKALQAEIGIMQWILAMKREHEEARELELLEAEEERLAQQNEIRRKHEQQLQAQRMQERKEKLEREAEEHRKCREREEIVNCIGSLRTSFREKCRDIGSLSKTCKDRHSAAAILAPLANRWKELGAQMEAISERTRSGEITMADLTLAENIVEQSEEVSNACRIEIARIDALYEEEIARRAEAMRQAEAEARAETGRSTELTNDELHRQIIEEQVARQLGSPGRSESGDTTTNTESPRIVESSAQPLLKTPADTNSRITEVGGTPTDVPSVDNATEETDGAYSDYQSLQLYMKTHVFLTNYMANYRELAQTSSLKKFRFECQKAINIPVNAISGVNASHLKEKYEMLKNLLMGKSSLNVTQHPQGVAFCKDILAKKIVSQGETLISSKPEMAFPVAAVAVALWNDYPDFGELLLAHFGRTCPYILPVFLPRLQGQTNEEYYRSLGYKYTEDGVVEKQDKYLTRMSGLVRLYASIIVTAQRRSANKPHPHGIENAWRWLASTLNTEPRPDLSDVCATVILDMLEVAGNSLWQAYPRQFPKLLVVLAQHYYPQMRNEAGIGGGPMARLEQFIKDCLTNKSIPPPEGQLPPDFW